ncbi:MAG: DNA replication and repair protein RecF [Candidatus Saccharimonadales bacterium]
MITGLRLQHFRSYEDATFVFGDGVNILVGPNGSGKTNLLEALLVAARGNSYRVGDGELVQFGSIWARIDAEEDDGHHRTLKLQNNGAVKKTYEINEKPYQRLPEHKKLPVVLFEPNHLLTLSGPPDGRRAYLDDILEQTTPGFTSFRRNYRRVLAQRNALLKQPNTKPEEFFPWNLRLGELGAVIHRSRTALIETFNQAIAQLYTELSKDDIPVTLAYESRFAASDYETKLFHMLESNLHQDTARGFTSHGPHREDFGVLFDGHPSHSSASRGEMRTAVLTLKILELRELHRATGRSPLLLLDDVFSELDSSRRHLLAAYMQHYQTFLTTTDADALTDTLAHSTLINIRHT